MGGAFAHRFSEPTWSLAVISFINRVRYRLTRNYYGDQGIFVRAAVFRELGGYPDVALMEDLILSQRLKRLGRTALIRDSALHLGPPLPRPRPLAHVRLHRLAARSCTRSACDTQRYASRWRGPADRPPG